MWLFGISNKELRIIGVGVVVGYRYYIFNVVF